MQGEGKNKLIDLSIIFDTCGHACTGCTTVQIFAGLTISGSVREQDETEAWVDGQVTLALYNMCKSPTIRERELALACEAAEYRDNMFRASGTLSILSTMRTHPCAMA